MLKQYQINWIDSGRKPTCSPNPDYPNGIDLDFSEGKISCKIDLPYPAKRIGIYLVRCNLCRITVGCTTAGRPDDPRSIRMPCNFKLN